MITLVYQIPLCVISFHCRIKKTSRGTNIKMASTEQDLPAFNDKDNDEWLRANFKESWISEFKENGFLVINNLLNAQDELPSYIETYDKLLNSIEAKKHRFDLGSHSVKESSVGQSDSHNNDDKIKNSTTDNKKDNGGDISNNKNVAGTEKICQIMWPSIYEENLLERPAFKRLLGVVQKLLGDDLEFDFDMLINKFPYSNTCTPWHQDASYWPPEMPDRRAASAWVALDKATVDNGCMWYVKGSHLEKDLRPHQRVKEGHRARFTPSCSEAEGEARPLEGGSCTLHHGRTLHYTRGNNTGTQRRAYIINFRPKLMVEWERQRQFDHGKTVSRK